MSLRPIQLWGHWGAPNPWKVRIILEELKLPYEVTFVEFSDVKQESYLAVTPNGRLPTIRDPNTSITLWESGAIIQYLVDEYDKTGSISYRTFPERHYAQQWLAFQISGQGPYFGQATWFARFHPEKIPSAISRYIDEIIRVIGVLEIGLERNGTGWLVGDKCTYADLAFITWASLGEGLLQEFGRLERLEEKFPRYVNWIKSMDERKTVFGIKEKIVKARAEHGLR